MNPTVLTTPTARGSEEEPMAAAGPQTSMSSVNPDQEVPLAYANGASTESFSTGVDSLAGAMAGIKALSQPGIEERRSLREKVPPERQPCEIEARGKVLSALLVNESEGGFALLVEEGEGLKVGKKVELRTNTLSFTVRVVYLRKIARPENACSKSDSWFRVGVKKTSRSMFSLFS